MDDLEVLAADAGILDIGQELLIHVWIQIVPQAGFDLADLARQPLGFALDGIEQRCRQIRIEFQFRRDEVLGDDRSRRKSQPGSHRDR